MASRNIDKFRILLTETMDELNESIKYLKEASKPIAPSFALGCLARMEPLERRVLMNQSSSDQKRDLLDYRMPWKE